MLAGWSVSDLAVQHSDNFTVASSTVQEPESGVTTPASAQNTTAATVGEENVADAGSSVEKEAVVGIDDGLLDNVDFDERLSHQI
jgi:hypothetical protein